MRRRGPQDAAARSHRTIRNPRQGAPRAPTPPPVAFTQRETHVDRTVQLRAFRRQWQQGDVVEHGEAASEVPAGVIESSTACLAGLTMSKISARCRFIAAVSRKRRASPLPKELILCFAPWSIERLQKYAVTAPLFSMSQLCRIEHVRRDRPIVLRHSRQYTRLPVAGQGV